MNTQMEEEKKIMQLAYEESIHVSSIMTHNLQFLELTQHKSELQHFRRGVSGPPFLLLMSLLLAL